MLTVSPEHEVIHKSLIMPVDLTVSDIDTRRTFSFMNDLYIVIPQRAVATYEFNRELFLKWITFVSYPPNDKSCVRELIAIERLLMLDVELS